MHRSRRVPEFEEAPQPPAFGFVSVHRQFRVIHTARMRDMILAAADGALVPSVHKIECERRVNADVRMQTFRRLPGAKTDSRDVLALRAGRMQRHCPAIAGELMARASHPA